MSAGGSKAEQYKQKGNTAFVSGDYPLALANFNTAIELDPSVAAYPLNRAAVYLKQREWARAEKDASTALELDGGANPKALFRRATARRQLGKLQLARQDLEEAKRQGAGADVDKELASLVESLNVNGNEPHDAPEAMGEAPSRLTSERLRAALDSKPRSSSSAPAGANGRTPEAGGNDLMKSVSTRRLSPAATAATAPKLDAAPAGGPEAVPPPPAAQVATPAGALSFGAKKEARMAKQKEAAAAAARFAPAASASETPTPVASTSAAAAAPLPAPPPSTTLESPHPRSTLLPPSPAPVSTSLRTHPTSSPTALEAHFLALPAPNPQRLAAVRALAHKYPPSPSPEHQPVRTTLREWMGPAGLTPDLLSDIVGEVVALVEPGSALHPHPAPLTAAPDLGWAVSLLEGLSTCQRWDSASLFLSAEERAGVGRILEREKARLDAIGRAWGVGS
ncbi:hypothetical protein JCM8202_001214 [Rhodotorula sphaerocarpa]